MSEQERRTDQVPAFDAAVEDTVAVVDGSAGTVADAALVDPDVAAPLAEAPDQVADAWVASLLADLPSAPMPADAWSRLSAALSAEAPLSAEVPLSAQAAPTAEAPPAGQLPPDVPDAPLAAGADVVPLHAGGRRRGSSGLPGWWRGVAAAAVAVLAVGIGVQVLRGGGSPGPVAGPAPGPAAGAQAAVAIPARQVLASGTSYTAARLKDQVRGLVDRAEDALRATDPAGSDSSAAGSVEEAGTGEDATAGSGAGPAVAAHAAAPVGTAGFTATAAGIRDCVLALAGSASVEAMVVDRATYEGRDAGIVVLPTDPQAATLDVWVVAPECARRDPHVLFFLRTTTTG